MMPNSAAPFAKFSGSPRQILEIPLTAAAHFRVHCADFGPVMPQNFSIIVTSNYYTKILHLNLGGCHTSGAVNGLHRAIVPLYKYPSTVLTQPNELWMIINKFHVSNDGPAYSIWAIASMKSLSVFIN